MHVCRVQEYNQLCAQEMDLSEEGAGEGEWGGALLSGEPQPSIGKLLSFEPGCVDGEQNLPESHKCTVT